MGTNNPTTKTVAENLASIKKMIGN
ncbi:hypothetical protein SAMN05216332_101149 [Nitrosospira briensis]|nr:hypothetical protein SAMN05216332_101149 [Nitrosospira briensis]